MEHDLAVRRRRRARTGRRREDGRAGIAAGASTAATAVHCAIFGAGEVLLLPKVPAEVAVDGIDIVRVNR